MITTIGVDRGIYKLQAEILKALANPVRLEILHVIGAGEASFGELLAGLGVSKTNLSQHLAVLRKSRIVTDRREGVNSFYRLTYPEIEAACSSVSEALARHLLEVGEQAKTLLRRANRRQGRRVLPSGGER